MPRRIRLSRSKGRRKPEGVIVVARPSRWGNPYRIGATPREIRDGDRGLWEAGGLQSLPDDRPLSREECVAAYRRWLPGAVDADGRPWVEAARRELAGHDLACWCPLPGPCHADALLEIANS